MSTSDSLGAWESTVGALRGLGLSVFRRFSKSLLSDLCDDGSVKALKI